MTGLTVTLVRESVHQYLSWSSRTGVGLPRAARSGRRPSGRPWRQVGVEDDLARGGQASPARAAGCRLGQQVEGGLGAGEVTERLARRASRDSVGAEGLLAPRRRGRGRGRGRGRRRGRARPRTAWCRRSGRPRRASVAWRGRRGAAVLGIGWPGRRARSNAEGLRDEPVELRGTDPARRRRRAGRRPTRRLRRQGGCGVDGGLGDEPGPPRRDGTGLDLRPQPREAVAQLEGVADELLRRRRRDPEDGAELGDAELRDQRRTLAGDGLLVLTPGHA